MVIYLHIDIYMCVYTSRLFVLHMSIDIDMFIYIHVCMYIHIYTFKGSAFKYIFIYNM
jgi:hypothetical protein